MSVLFEGSGFIPKLLLGYLLKAALAFGGLKSHEITFAQRRQVKLFIYL